MNTANKLTMLRILIIPVFLILLLGNYPSPEKSRLWASALFILAALTDTLDGYIARKYHMITNFGKFLDPLADKLLVCSAMIALVEKGDLKAYVVIIIISREFIVTGFRLVAASSHLVIAASWWGKIKTVIQMLLTVYLLLDMKRFGIIFEAINGLLIFLAVIFTLLSGADYIMKNYKVLLE